MTGTTTARWSGSWIAPGPRTGSGVLETLHGGPPPEPFSRPMCRRPFDLGAVPAEAPARIPADSRYVLWVNGREVGRGPARSQPYRQRFDGYDLAPYLEPGTNVVSVLVTYLG